MFEKERNSTLSRMSTNCIFLWRYAYCESLNITLEGKSEDCPTKSIDCLSESYTKFSCVRFYHMHVWQNLKTTINGLLEFKWFRCSNVLAYVQFLLQKIDRWESDNVENCSVAKFKHNHFCMVSKRSLPKITGNNW